MINHPHPHTTDDVPSRETVTPGVADAIVSSATTDGSSGERREGHYVDQADNQTEKQVEVYQDTNQGRANRRSWVTNVIYFLFSVLEVILALRFAFRLLGANQENSFTQFLYNLTHLFVAPFHGILNDPVLGTRNVFELSTLITMLVSALILWGLVSLSRLVFAPSYNGRQQVTTTREKQG